MALAPLLYLMKKYSFYPKAAFLAWIIAEPFEID